MFPLEEPFFNAEIFPDLHFFLPYFKSRHPCDCRNLCPNEHHEVAAKRQKPAIDQVPRWAHHLSDVFFQCESSVFDVVAATEKCRRNLGPLTKDHLQHGISGHQTTYIDEGCGVEES